jgi:SAM-dependent methyltransferase
MTFWGGAHHLSRLLTLDPKEWAYFPYWVNLKLRCIDVDFAGLEELGLSASRSNVHSQSGGPDLRAVLKAIGVSAADSILDIGCGKGGAMLTMARFPFARIDGVELSPRLARIARENFIRAGVGNVRVYCCDATEFTAFDRYRYLYMYNPFPEPVMRRVLQNVAKSARGAGKRITLIYRHPVSDKLLREARFVRTHEFHYHVLNYPPGYAADRTFHVYDAPCIEANADEPCPKSVPVPGDGGR